MSAYMLLPIIIMVFTSLVIVCAASLTIHYYRIARRMEASARRGWAIISQIERMSGPDDAAKAMAETALRRERTMTESI